MDPLTPAVYFLPTRLGSEELRQWAEKAASLVRVTQTASEADFIVGKSKFAPCPPFSFELRVPLYMAVARPSTRVQSLDFCSIKEG
jgi:hypothetical protein